MSNSTRYLNKLQLQAELARCLDCKTQPCMHACPVNCNPHEFIQFARIGDWKQAVQAITRYNPMGQTCGLICPDKFCMQSCTRHHIDFAINIPRVQATILENCREKDDGHQPVDTGRHIAIIGAGPAGIAAAAALANAGIHVDIFEASDQIGGALNMIPRERLPHEVIERDWDMINAYDFITLHLRTKIENVQDLCQNFDGVIVATGEPNRVSLRIPGEELAISYMDYLSDPEKYRTDEPVAVIGGGNVAADCALTAQRLGSQSVEMFIRRRISDMRISRPEYLELLGACINLTGMTSPQKIELNGDHKILTIHRNVLRGEKWVMLDNSAIALPYFKHVICAIGSRADAKIEPCPPNLIYAGDCKTGGSTIVEAIASGRSAAAALI